ncbi:ABC-F family ATP-binding cassette domain-containing protein [[Brevibacterium] frigoritolerans]|uniref:ABC-F family ATP-binding cassette domain-containing protein n=1 Tax=Peribacillus frigoritolerans TaxID=450367 RepID=A0A941J9W1_9BACI|nr:ABC-F family ATP-binding cassette domain-containing protein [Peribacillus frigoritolerans]
MTKRREHSSCRPKWSWKINFIENDHFKLPALSGDFRFGTNVEVSYYDQEQANLVSNKRVLNELWDDYPLKPEKDIRTVLGNFLFSGDDVLKTVSTLSGGEKARLALAKLMMQKAIF